MFELYLDPEQKYGNVWQNWGLINIILYCTHQIPELFAFQEIDSKMLLLSKEEQPAGPDSRKVCTAPSRSGTSSNIRPWTNKQLKSKSGLTNTF